MNGLGTRVVITHQLHEAIGVLWFCAAVYEVFVLPRKALETLKGWNSARRVRSTFHADGFGGSKDPDH
jgi:hypothetical protein